MAETTGSRFDIIKAIFRLGSGSKAQSCDGTFTAGNLPVYKTTPGDGTTGDSGIAATNVALISKLQQESYTYSADTGSANAYAVTLSPAPTIQAGSGLVFKAANANTGASTLAVNGAAAAPLTKNGTTALASGDIVAGQIITAKYDGANWQIIASQTISGQPYDMPCFLAGKPAAGQVVLKVVFARTVVFPANFASNPSGKAGANPTATATYTINKVSGGTTTSIGNVSISTSGAFTFTTSGGASVSFALNDVMMVLAPGTSDSTLSDVAMTFVGTR